MSKMITKAIRIQNKASLWMLSSVVLSLFLSIYAQGEPVVDAASRLDQAGDYLSRDQYTQAEQLYREVSEQNEGTDIDLQARKGLAITYAFQKRDSEVDTVVDRLIADFSAHRDVTQTVCQVGDHYFSANDYQRSRQLFQRVIDECPNNVYSMWAQCGITNSHILAREDAAAEGAMSNLVAKYSVHDDTAMAICLVADNYYKLNNRTKADALCKMVAETWSQHDYPVWSGMRLAMHYIDEGNIAMAESMVDNLFANHSGHQHFIRAVCYVAGRYYDRKASDKATALYQRIADENPETIQEMWPQLISLIANIRLTDTDVTPEAIDRIQANYASHPELPEAISWLAEIYYKDGTVLQAEGSIDEAREHFEKAIAIWDEVKGTPYEHVAHYQVGLCYQALGDYSKAAGAFADSYQANPTFQYADYCLFAQGDCHERLMRSRTLSEAEAKPVITELYSELISKYPQSPYAPNAASWLQKN